MVDEPLLTSPRVSVIIPAYNAAEFINETLDSVFAQTFSDFEVIVVNDGSPDTEDLERALKRYPEKLRYIKQENQGAAAARNTGIRAASGEFVAFLDADDTWLPTFLQKQLELLQRTRADFVYADALLTGNSPLSGRTFMEVQPSRGDVTAASLLAVQVTVLTSTVLARKQPIIDVGMFDVTLRRGHDFELWLRLAKHNIRFAYQHEILAHHRILETGLSGGVISQLERTLSVLDKIRTRDDLSEKEKAALQLNLNRTRAELALEEGKDRLLSRDFDAAAGSFRRARELGGGWKLRLVCAGMQLAPDLLRRAYQARVSRRRTAEV
ncbi:MAG TPA: glycosyltransferase family 2 protein [Pyrinomonadaceae bacterium]